MNKKSNKELNNNGLDLNPMKDEPSYKIALKEHKIIGDYMGFNDASALVNYEDIRGK